MTNIDYLLPNRSSYDLRWPLRLVISLAAILSLAGAPQIVTGQKPETRATSSVLNYPSTNQIDNQKPAVNKELFTAAQLKQFPDLRYVDTVLGRRPFLHDHEVRNIAFSNDGKRLLTTSRHGLRVWDVHSRKLLREIPFEGPNDVFLAINRSMDRIVLAGDFGDVQVLEWPSGKRIRRMPRKAPLEYIRSVALSPDGKRLAICYRRRERMDGDRGLLTIWSIDDDRITRDLSLPISYAMAWSPDGANLAVGLRTGAVRFVSPEGKPVGEDIKLELAEPIMGLDFTQMGLRLAVTTMQGSAGVWKIVGGKRTKVWYRKGEGAGHRLVEGPLGGIVYDDARNRVYFKRFRYGIVVCDAQTGEEIKAVEKTSQARFASNPAFSPGEKILAMADGSRAVRLFDPSRLESLIAPTNNDYSSINFMLPRPGAPELITVVGGRVDVWNLDQRRVVKTLFKSSYISAAKFNSNGSRLAIAYHQDQKAGRSAGVDILDAKTHKSINTLKMDSYAARGVAFSADGSKLAAVGVRGVYYWDMDSGKRLWKREVGGPRDWLEQTAIHPGGKTLAVIQFLREQIQRRPLSHTSRGKVVLLQAGNGKVVRVLEGPGTPQRLAFSRDGSKLFASTSRYSTGQPGETIPAVNIWDLSSGELVREPGLDVLVRESTGPASFDINSGRAWITSRTNLKSQRLTLWRLTDGENVKQLELPGSFADISVLPGDRLAAAKRNGEIYLLNLTDP